MADYPAVYKAYGDRFLEVAQGLEALRDKVPVFPAARKKTKGGTAAAAPPFCA